MKKIVKHSKHPKHEDKLCDSFHQYLNHNDAQFIIFTKFTKHSNKCLELFLSFLIQ